LFIFLNNVSFIFYDREMCENQYSYYAYRMDVHEMNTQQD